MRMNINPIAGIVLLVLLSASALLLVGCESSSTNSGCGTTIATDANGNPVTTVGCD